MRGVNRQHLSGLQRLTDTRIPALEVLHFDIEALGDHVQRVALLDFVLGLRLLFVCFAVGCHNGVDSTAVAFGRVLHHQRLADLEVLAGQFVPALQILDIDFVGLGDGAQLSPRLTR